MSWTAVMSQHGKNTCAITRLTIHGARCSQVVAMSRIGGARITLRWQLWTTRPLALVLARPLSTAMCQCQVPMCQVHMCLLPTCHVATGIRVAGGSGSEPRGLVGGSAKGNKQAALALVLLGTWHGTACGTWVKERQTGPNRGQGHCSNLSVSAIGAAEASVSFSI
jgi:hypothetical protein